MLELLIELMVGIVIMVGGGWLLLSGLFKEIDYRKNLKVIEPEFLEFMVINTEERDKK